MSRYQDRIGKIYGNLLVQKKLDEVHPITGEPIWYCLCNACKKYCKLSSSQLSETKRKTCGCRKKVTVHKNSKYPGGFTPKMVETYLGMRGGRVFPTDSATKWDILEDFCLRGILQNELAEKYNAPLHSVRRFISDTRRRLNQTFELTYMDSTKNVPIAPEKLHKVLCKRFTSEELKGKVSPYGQSGLTDEEMLYSLVFVRTGSNKAALQASGLADALSVKDTVRMNLLGLWLRKKPNVADYLKELKKEQVESIDVNKPTIQNELVQQISQLKELAETDGVDGTSNRSQLLRAIEMLGKTIGAFQENIRITEVDPAKALDHVLIEMEKVNSEYSIEELEDKDE